MKILQSVVAVTLVSLASLAGAAEGLLAVRSPHSAKETMNRLEAIVKQHGLNVFARIDHAARDLERAIADPVAELPHHHDFLRGRDRDDVHPVGRFEHVEVVFGLIAGEA